MNWLNDLLQGIPLNAVLRERLALVEQRFKDMEEKLTAVIKERDELKRQIAEAPAAMPTEKPEIRNGVYYFAGDESPYCPRCFEREGRKHVMADNLIRLKCTVCGNMIVNR